MLTEKIAAILYTADVQPVDWDQALDDDRAYYRRVADVVLDAVVSHLQDQPAGDIPFRAVGDYLQAEADIERLKR